MLRLLSTGPAADLMRDALVGLAPGLCQLLAGWIILG